MTDCVIVIDSGTGPQHVSLETYLDEAREEAAAKEAHAWIKRLRHARIDGQPLRRRFTFRGDSLWWFAELYLHKQQVVHKLFRTLAALEALVERERPLEISVARGNHVVSGLAEQVAATRRIRFRRGAGFGRGSLARMAALHVRGAWLQTVARASRLRSRGVPAVHPSTRVVAFVHRAFWRSGGAESYIGPVLQTLEQRLPRGAVQYVSVGPSENFPARRWWHAFSAQNKHGAVPVEAFAPVSMLTESRQVWRERWTFRRALWNSEDLRHAAVIRGCNCWPVIREELAGIAFLQWPWSARSMDEAGAVLDVLRPVVAMTYAEAGGWGRAVVLECRRRNIPTVGIQHGFIYRHWLNYLHEPDEMVPDPDRPSDRGFPRPSVTLVFDDFTARQLADSGCFPRESVCVTGSARLDALVNEARGLTAADIEGARSMAGARSSDLLVLLATKYREARRVLPSLVQAVQQLPGMHLAIKTHPAETPDVYREVAADRAHVTVLPASAPLAPLLRASSAVVTVNSTVALDAAVLGVPALVIGLPNNLTPFVDAGIMAGASAEQIGPALKRILYDEEFLQELRRTREQCLARFGVQSDGRAAERAADAVLRLGAGVAEPPVRDSSVI